MNPVDNNNINNNTTSSASSSTNTTKMNPYQQYNNSIVQMNAMSAIHPSVHGYLPNFINDYGTTLTQQPNMDSFYQLQRRKMMRRAANRKSAQASRARKKAVLESTKAEITNLRHLRDIIESLPVNIFCFTATGNITYISEKTIQFLSNLNIDNPNHLLNIFTKECVANILTLISNQTFVYDKLFDVEINDNSNNNNVSSQSQQNKNDIAAYIKISKVIKKVDSEINYESDFNEPIVKVNISNLTNTNTNELNNNETSTKTLIDENETISIQSGNEQDLSEYEGQSDQQTNNENISITVNPNYEYVCTFHLKNI